MGKALKILVAAAMNSNENHHRASFALSQNNQLQQQNKDHSSRPLDVHWFFVVLSSGCPLFFCWVVCWLVRWLSIGCLLDCLLVCPFVVHWLFVGLSAGWFIWCSLVVCWIVCYPFVVHWLFVGLSAGWFI